MTTNGRTVPCPVKQVIKKYVRDVPCPRVQQPKGKQDAPCTASDCKKALKRIEKVSCPEVERRRASKCTKRVEKLPETCPVGNGRSTSPQGCPKCEENRIQRLECEVFQLRREIERMKQNQKEAEKKLQKAILRGACALGDGLKTHVPDSIEKLLNSCDSEVSASASYSVTLCSRKPTPIEIRPCGAKPTKKKQPICCQSCCAD